MNATEIQAEKAIEKLEFVIRAAKNGNQGGENAVVKYSRAFRAHDELVNALEAFFAIVDHEDREGSTQICFWPESDLFTQMRAALSKASGEQP